MDVDDLLGRLSVQEKASLTAGRDLWTVPGLPDHGIPSISVTDGPNGARGSALMGLGRVSSCCVPCGSSLGASWDPALVEEVGQVLGEEARTKAARVLLAPTINLHRHPLGGRGFECYSEDPLLTGKIAAGFIRGVQSRGVAACAKHLVANESEHERTSISSVVDERSLRELYLLPFELAVREGGLLTVMTSYNRVNGEWCSEDRALLTDWLRGEVGFDGVVMTDWFAIGSTALSAEAGLDLQMPGPDRFFGAVLAKAVADGGVEEAVLDAIVTRWLSLIDRLGAWEDEPQPEESIDLPDHREVARRACSSGTVLLKNDGVLPLAETASIALIGPLAGRAHIMGGGSAQLRPHRAPSLLDAWSSRPGLVHERGCDVDKAVRVLTATATVEVFASTDWSGPVHESFTSDDLKLLWFDQPIAGLTECSFRATTTLSVEAGPHQFDLVQAGRARLLVDGELVIDGFADPPPMDPAMLGLGSEPMAAVVDLQAGSHQLVLEWTSRESFLLQGAKVGHRPPDDGRGIERAVAAARAADVAVVVVGTTEEWETEGHDRLSLALPGQQDELVARVCEANPRTVVVVCAGAPVAMPWAAAAGAVVLPWLGGQELAYALDDVLTGRIDPGGRLPVTLPLRIEHTPAFGSYPGDNDEVVYSERLLVGYRWYDTRALPVAFPFGHGGSYTTFDWGPATVDRTGVRVPVTNTGDRTGSEVIQVYVRPHAPRLSRPRMELKGFAKLELAPGEQGIAQIALDDRAFAYWDNASPDHPALEERLLDASLVPTDKGPTPRTTKGWYVDPGRYDVVVARSVADVVEVVTIEL